MNSSTDPGITPLGYSRAILPVSGREEPLRSILSGLLEGGTVAAVLTLQKTTQPGRFVHALVSDPECLSRALPFHPVMPVQGAKVLSELTREGSPGEKVAVLLRPCELRAFVENVKQAQGSLDDLIVISCSCPGVIPSGRLLDSDRERVLERYRTSVDNGDIPADVRRTCSCCTAFMPGDAVDMTVDLTGGSSPAPAGTVYIHSERAMAMVSGIQNMDIKSMRGTLNPPDRLLRTRNENLRALVTDVKDLPVGLPSLLDVFSACIGCRACRQVCPLCHCVICDYETDRTRWSPEKVSRQARSRGALRVPSGTLQFHLGRLMHISASCVSCGQCTDACPVGIPVGEIFTRAGRLVQRTLGYSPGEDSDGKPPMATFEVRELEEITG